MRGPGCAAYIELGRCFNDLRQPVPMGAVADMIKLRTLGYMELNPYPFENIVNFYVWAFQRAPLPKSTVFTVRKIIRRSSKKLMFLM